MHIPAVIAASFLGRMIMKGNKASTKQESSLLRELPAGQVSHQTAYAHIQYAHTLRITKTHTKLAGFPMTAWEFFCSRVTIEWDTEKEKKCLCVKPAS